MFDHTTTIKKKRAEAANKLPVAASHHRQNMKTHFAISGLLAVFVLHSTNAAQPNIRTQSQNQDSERRAERSGGIKGFFKGVVGEIREGGAVIGEGFRDVRDGIKSRINGDDNGGRNQAPPRYGYQSPPPPPINNGGNRPPRDPGPPSGPNARGGSNAALPTSAPRERTIPRKPATPPAMTRQPEAVPPPAPRSSPKPRELAPEPRRDTPPAPEKVETPTIKKTPVVNKTPEPSAPEIVTPRKQEPMKQEIVPAPVDASDPPAVENSPPAPQPEDKPVAEDRDGNPLPDKPDFPTATATKDPGIVLSPYPPYDTLDVKGMAPGSLARDPATGQIFRVP